MPRLALPIDGAIAEIRSALEKGRSLVIEAAPGSGKTTRVPPVILDTEFARGREVLVLEPRRLAAKLSARRVAEELGEPLGQTVGYQFRMENVGGPKTRLRYITEGMLMRRMLRDPQLRNVAAVVLDEFHERHMQGDLALAVLQSLRAGPRADLRLVIMSATLESARLATYLGDCPVVKVDTRRFEVDVRYLPSSQPVDRAVLTAVERAVQEDVGDILVFLPGMAEIRRCENKLEELAHHSRLMVLALHGELSKEDQEQALGKQSRRKVILATNVAETSLTIEGVNVVIDSGFARVASYSFWSGMPALRTRPISRASAIQRAGRAGRTGPGVCYRLYSEADFQGRPSFETPEILRADLAQPWLEVMALGFAAPSALPWLEPPSDRAQAAANSLLHDLGAASLDGAITETGRLMARKPVHPRLARMLVEAEKRGCGEQGAILAAAIAEGKIERMDCLAQLGEFARDSWIKRVAERLREGAQGTSLALSAEQADLALRFSVLTGFPDRVARKRSGSERNSEVELVFSSGGSATAALQDLPAANTFVALDLEERQRQGQLKAHLQLASVIEIDESWLFDLLPTQLKETEEISWSSERSRVESVSRLVYGALTLSESRGVPNNLEQTAKVLAEQVYKLGHWKTQATERLLERLDFLQSLIPDLEAKSSEQLVQELLQAACQGLISLAETKDLALGELMLGMMPEERRKKLDAWVPDTVALQRGRRVKVNYEPGKPPWIQSRLQDFFGMKTGPVIAGGRVPLTIHLLAPNQRAVQVTSDLAGFWERIYPSLRRELGRRYPRHAWPEDPHA